MVTNKAIAPSQRRKWKKMEKLSRSSSC